MQVDLLFPINANAFTYNVPGDLKEDIRIGVRVLAPFKNSEKIGIVIAIKEGEEGINLRPIKAIIDKEPLLTDGLIRLIIWVSHYYMSTSGLALKNAVPLRLLSRVKSGRPRVTYDREVTLCNPISLNKEQQKALNEIKKREKGVFLLHGVTGSGKTEVYIHAIKSLPENKEAIVLVPEIAITSQIVDRFRMYFGDRVVFYHSGLSDGERINSWKRMRDGEAKVVVGVRSAVFSPFKNLGLIIVDEEHEASYKQFEGVRYNARDVAIVRAKIEGIRVILGSATPSIETYYNAKKGRFHLLELTKRVDEKPLPHIEIIDMTKEPKRTKFFSERLINALKENLVRGYQSVLLLNQRGYAPYLICADCGYTYRCNLCSITFTYHKETRSLKCHYCGSYKYPDKACPRCNGIRFRYVGIGTERLEEELAHLIPELRLRRMDRDTTRRKLSHYRMIKEMIERKIDVLLGTQMVAKGHDLPDVAIAVVVSADVALHIPDFRSSERAFQLFTQLAGRAGRGEVHGDVYIQTYEQGHYVFDYVKKNDYKGFFYKELYLRNELGYPPFNRLIRIIINFKEKEMIKRIINELSGEIERMELGGIHILGPSPAPIEKIKNLWRWHLILKGDKTTLLRQKAYEIIRYLNTKKGVKVVVDVDPIDLL